MIEQLVEQLIIYLLFTMFFWGHANEKKWFSLHVGDRQFYEEIAEVILVIWFASKADS